MTCELAEKLLIAGMVAVVIALFVFGSLEIRDARSSLVKKHNKDMTK